MNRLLTLWVVVLVASLFVGGTLQAQASTRSASPAAAAAQPAGDDAAGGGYWAAWSDAASH
jgi:hypothetical protein